MKIFVTGATGYIGGSVADGLISAGHEVHGLARSEARASEARERGIEPLIGTLDDAALLARAAGEADAVVNAANADHRGAAEAMLAGLAGSGKLFLHTSGSSIVGNRAGGEASDQVFDETTPLTPSPARAARVALDRDILAAADSGVRAAIICPSLIYGQGRGAGLNSVQVPWLIDLARKYGVARHIGSGGNIWSNVHIGDLVMLYLLAFEQAPAGAFYYAESGENSMREVCQAISRMLGFGGDTDSMTIEEAAAEWGEGPANDTMASNSRVRAERARQELKWMAKAPSLIDEIERGCYA
ncbi:MAG: NAD-dependent epimerase/dehydratase family protein [Alphaproteobacteria bacterium]|jgi:nucleoside-diphosphate-sugar epimerase|nr:epimerase [Rhodospirillaceae bacterium]MDP6406915.1 NAD-dependent epimerase/dehydratase family protein [Alphaproteobacteria bacterium]MDP6622988.1 NAD-dependent epimerase/dehydratase family protein [Alphaproteobacteria bacterium]